MRIPYQVLFPVLIVAFLAGCNRQVEEAVDWRKVLAQESLEEEEFTAAFAALLRERAPGLAVEVTGSLELAVSQGGEADGGEPLRCFLDNTWSLCADAPGERAEICGNFADSLLGLGGGPGAGSTGGGPDAIVPVLKDRTWFDETAAMAPDDPIHAEPLVADLLVVYALDLERSMQFLTRTDVDGLELSPNELRALSVMNLRNRLPEVTAYGGDGLSMMVAGGSYEASLLLLDDIWVKQSDACEGELVAAVPARDLLYFADSGSEEALTGLREMVSESIQSSAYRLSDALLVWRAGRWQAFDD